MILTDKAKIEFEKWLFKEYDLYYYNIISEIIWLNALIIEWFDSVGIYISIEVYGTPDFKIQYESNVSTKTDDWYLQGMLSEIYSTRQEATIKAIEKANEIFNNQN